MGKVMLKRITQGAKKYTPLKDTGKGLKFA
jgi:hypothetical protein